MMLRTRHQVSICCSIHSVKACVAPSLRQWSPFHPWVHCLVLSEDQRQPNCQPRCQNNRCCQDVEHHNERFIPLYQKQQPMRSMTSGWTWPAVVQGPQRPIHAGTSVQAIPGQCSASTAAHLCLSYGGNQSTYLWSNHLPVR